MVARGAGFSGQQDLSLSEAGRGLCRGSRSMSAASCSIDGQQDMQSPPVQQSTGPVDTQPASIATAAPCHDNQNEVRA